MKKDNKTIDITHEQDGMDKMMEKKVKAKKAKKHMKVEGHKAKARLDKPMKKASGGAVSKSSSFDTDDAGVSPSSPFAIGSPQRKRGGKC